MWREGRLLPVGQRHLPDRNGYGQEQSFSHDTPVPASHRRQEAIGSDLPMTPGYARLSPYHSLPRMPADSTRLPEANTLHPPQSASVPPPTASSNRRRQSRSLSPQQLSSLLQQSSHSLRLRPAGSGSP